MMTMSMIAGVGFVVGAALAGLAVWVAMSGRVSRLRAELALAGERLAFEKQGRENDRRAGERLCAEKEKALNEKIEAMMAKVSVVTAEQLALREKALAEKNGEQVRSLLAPMHQRLEDFRKAAEESKRTNGELGLKIEGFFKGIRDTSLAFGAQAKSFTDALTGANKKQGNWGEAILGEMLSSFGLKEGTHYLAQTGSGSGIPDYQVFDPAASRILVIDAKMSWTNYEEAYRLPAGEARTAALRDHVLSVKRHIDELERANYPATQVPPREGYRYVPLTAMFVPCDAALAAALEADATLVDYAFRRNVALVSPLSLFGFLLLVSRAWSRYATDRNSDAIFEEAKKLVGYVDRLFKNLEELGDSLGKAKEKYDAVVQVAAKEPAGQCIKGPALKIIKLGVKVEKAIKSKELAEA